MECRNCGEEIRSFSKARALEMGGGFEAVFCVSCMDSLTGIGKPAPEPVHKTLTQKAYAVGDELEANGESYVVSWAWQKTAIPLHKGQTVMQKHASSQEEYEAMEVK